MSYGFDDKVKDAEGGSKFIQPGIRKGTFLKEVKFIPASGTTAASLEIVVCNKDEQTVSRRYFEPTLGDIIKTQEELTKAINKFAKVVANLTRRFLGDNYTVPQQPTFEAFCKRAIQDLYTKASAFPLTELRSKVVLNSGGYPTLPSYAPIFELASVPDEQSKLKIDPAWDVIEVPKSPSASTPAGQLGAKVDPANPF